MERTVCSPLKFKKAFSAMAVIFLMLFHTTRAQEMVYVDNGVDRVAGNLGGSVEFRRLFEQELIYPEKELAEKKGGKVQLSFIVKEDGTVADVKVKQSVTPAIDAEALRIFKMLLWKPTIYRGKPISEYHDITFDFNPSKYKKICKTRGYTTIAYPHQPVDSSLVIHTKPDQLPVHPEGPYVQQDFVAKNVQYPPTAATRNLQGTVLLSFIVEPSGMVSNINVEKGVEGGCSEEAIRVLQMMKWMPGIKDGKAVRTRMTYPFIFSLNDGFRDNSLGEQK
jgi:TonB family protein